MTSKQPIVRAILLMAGSGMRTGSSTPKQFHFLQGKRVYMYALETFLRVSFFSEIIIVCHPLWLDIVNRETEDFSIVRVVPGGSSRQHSSYLGLLACTGHTDYVVIHDAARPFVTKDIVERNIQEVLMYQAVNTCIPSSDTIVHTKDGAFIDTIPLRREYWCGQTPQSFSYPLIRAAHEKAQDLEASDDCSLLKDNKIRVVIGNELNKKITTELDLFLAEQFLIKNVVI